MDISWKHCVSYHILFIVLFIFEMYILQCALRSCSRTGVSKIRPAGRIRPADGFNLAREMIM